MTNSIAVQRIHASAQGDTGAFWYELELKWPFRYIISYRGCVCGKPNNKIHLYCRDSSNTTRTMETLKASAWNILEVHGSLNGKMDPVKGKLIHLLEMPFSKLGDPVWTVSIWQKKELFHNLFNTISYEWILKLVSGCREGFSSWQGWEVERVISDD